MNRLLLLAALAALLAPAVSAQPWTYDFGTGTGAFTTTSGSSTTFLPAPPSGTTFVRHSSAAGADIVLANPGDPTLGTATELQLFIPNATTSVTKASVLDYGSATALFYNQFSLLTHNGTGTAYFFEGNGASYASGSAFSGAEVFTGLRLVQSAGTITTSYRLAGAWVALPGISTTVFVPNTVYAVEVYGNNTAGAVSYDRSGFQTLAAGTWDLWVNGTLVANDLGKALLPTNTVIDSYMFYGESAANATTSFKVDDITYSNALPAPVPVTVTQTANGPRGYRMLSAPVEGMTVSDLADLSLVQGISDEFSAAAPNLFTTYDGTDYLEPAAEATALEPGRGLIWYLYRRAFDPDATDTDGESESAGLPLTLTETGVPVTNPDVTFTAGERPGTPDDFYLIGNPFPAGFQLSGLGLSSGTLQGGVVYVFSPDIGDYVTLDADNTDASTDVAASWQGFFAEATGATLPLTFTFARAAQTADVPLIALTGGGSPTVVSAVAATARLDLTLTAADAAGNQAVDAVTRLVLRDDARGNWDRFDGTEPTGLGAQEARIAFRGTRGGTPVWQGIDARPVPNGNRGLPLDLRVRGFAGEATATLTWAGLETLPAGMTVELRDLAGGQRVVLAPGASYTFAASATEGWAERFRLRLISSPAASAAALAAPPSVAVAPNPFAGRAEVRVTLPVAERVVAAVYDALGRRVAVLHDGELEATTTALTLDGSSLSPGVYVVRVAGETFGETRRVTVVR
jgi:hypothetical protein